MMYVDGFSFEGCIRNILWAIGLLLLLLMAAGRKRRHKWLSSRRCPFQIAGALLKSTQSILSTGLLILVSLPLLPKAVERLSDGNYSPPDSLLYKTGVVAFCCILFGIVAYVVANLNRIYSLRRQETRITFSQIILLATFGLCLTLTVFALGIKKDGNGFILVTTFGAVLGWIFQDTIKSVAAFFYLRANGLLKIGDLISVPSKDIEGFVRTISLTTVTIENWDTTTSAFPTHILHSGHFKNSQRMLDGKTLGRLMQKTFIVDSGWIRPLSETEVERLRRELDVDRCFIDREVYAGRLNIEVFRQYIYNYLMNNPRVSQQPRLVVRWLEQTDEGLPLQLFVYLTDTAFDAFEWQQSLIIEHVVKAVGWFDIRLYQRPSGYDASNSNVYLTQNSADYRKKTEDNAKLKK